MRSQIAPDPYLFVKQLKAMVANHSPYAQALAFKVGERHFRLSRKTMAGIAGRDVQFVTGVLSLMADANGVLIDGLADLISPGA